MKRISALLLALLFAVTMLAACGASADVPNTPAEDEENRWLDEEPDFYGEDEYDGEDFLAPGDEEFLDGSEAGEDDFPLSIEFYVDRNILSVDAEEYLGDAAADYFDLIEAACSGESALALTDVEAGPRILEVFGDSPYSGFATAELNGDKITLTYGEGNAELFEETVQILVEGSVFADSNDLETALGLYRTVAEGMYFEEGGEESLYHALTEFSGSSESFARALQYLFSQCGIEAKIVSGSAADTTHYWVAAVINDEWYHFDPTFENSATSGIGLSYFGMSDEMRAYTGCDAPYTLGFGGYAETVDELPSGTYFDDLLQDVTDWRMDAETHFLFLAYNFTDDYSTAISTVDGEVAVG